MTHPFGLPSVAGNEYVIRDALAASKEDKSISFVAEVPQGAIIQFMVGGRDALLQAGADAAILARGEIRHESALVFIADCVSRLLVLGVETEKELRNIAKHVGMEVPMIGFFSFGEISSETDRAAFHNKTCSLYVMPE
ncbi:MAG: hypothetical protein UX83_C0007G0052 [Candidatus Wolfebacteria bacterium GW2011_GWE2_47_12]|nr:MAG: hypothetical protein UX83_C0007G0052 [Candidatus Wolfebacteria bacterium GW2011_GWE2_47_12]